MTCGSPCLALPGNGSGADALGLTSLNLAFTVRHGPQRDASRDPKAIEVAVREGPGVTGRVTGKRRSRMGKARAPRIGDAARCRPLPGRAGRGIRLGWRPEPSRC